MITQLVLYSENNDCAPKSVAAVESMLISLGFIEANQSASSVTFEPGEQFMNLVSFVGCSPVINLKEMNSAQTAGMPRIEVILSDVSERPVFLYGKNTRPPRCNSCSAKLTDWDQQLGIADNADYRIRCDSCQADNDVCAFNWGKHACLTRFYIAINGIYPREAIPMDSFLNELVPVFNSKVSYCYIQVWWSGKAESTGLQLLSVWIALFYHRQNSFFTFLIKINTKSMV